MRLATAGTETRNEAFEKPWRFITGMTWIRQKRSSTPCHPCNQWFIKRMSFGCLASGSDS
jgi:hypothetical protein